MEKGVQEDFPGMNGKKLVTTKGYFSPGPDVGREFVRCEESPFDTLAPAYDAWFQDEGKLIFAIETKALQMTLPSLPEPWLEVGVGSGRFAQSLGIKTGIDPSSGLLAIAKGRGIEVIRAKGETQTFDEETFGTIFLITTLCFVDSPTSVLQECNRILNPAGKIALGLVLRNSPWGRLSSEKKRQGHRLYKHATFYSYQEIVKLLEHAGFSIEKVVSTLLQKPNEVQKMEMPKEGFFPDAGFTVIIARRVPTRLSETKNKDTQDK